MNNIEKFMMRAIELSKKSIGEGGGPFGCVIVKNDTIIAEGYNLVTKNNDPTAHAEINVIRSACEKINNYRINNSVLYTTLEPCLMCVGAICEARIECVVFGAYSSSDSSIDEKFKVLKEMYNLDHTTKFIGGILQNDCSLMLRNFFKRKRS